MPLDSLRSGRYLRAFRGGCDYGGSGQVLRAALWYHSVRLRHHRAVGARLHGVQFCVWVSAGIAIGTVRVLAAVDYAVERRLIDDPQAEMDRFRAARDTAVAQLKQLRDNVAAEFGENKAELFDAHRLMLQDPDYAECVEGLIAQDKVNAEFAVKSAAEQFAAMFAAMDSSTMPV